MPTVNHGGEEFYPGKVRVINEIADFLVQCANEKELTAQQQGRIQGCVAGLRRVTSSQAPRMTQELQCEMLRCLAYIPGDVGYPWSSFLDAH
jgi:hypothetical protein